MSSRDLDLSPKPGSPAKRRGCHRSTKPRPASRLRPADAARASRRRSHLPSGYELGGSRLQHLAKSCRIFSRIFAENEPRQVFCFDQGSRDLIWERFYPFLIGGSGAGRSGSLKVGPARVFQDRHAAPEGDVFLREDESERHRLCAAGR